MNGKLHRRHGPARVGLSRAGDLFAQWYLRDKRLSGGRTARRLRRSGWQAAKEPVVPVLVAQRNERLAENRKIRAEAAAAAAAEAPIIEKRRQSVRELANDLMERDGIKPPY